MAQAINWRTNIIRPNLTQDGYVAEKHGIHGSLSFGYLPPLATATEVVQGRIEVLQAAGRHGEAAEEMQKFVSDYLQSWSEKEPCTLENIRLLRPQLLFRVFRILANVLGSDPVPGAAGSPAKSGEDIAGKS